jgi:hypothetical protein
MALVIARIRRAEERERADSAQDSKYVNREKIFSSSSSAQCTEVEYATEWYSESPPPVCTKTDEGEPAERERHRDFALRIQAEYDSSSDEAPTASRSIYVRVIHCQIDHNDISSACLLTTPISFAMQSALPWATETILHLRRFVPLPPFHCLIGINSSPARYAV